MRLKLDENIGRRWAEQLRDAGHGVDTVQEEHLSGATDTDVLAAAQHAGRALVTLDLDFANPIRFPPTATSGIVVARVRERPGRHELDAVVSRLIVALSKADVAGHLWIVERDRVRHTRSLRAEPPSYRTLSAECLGPPSCCTAAWRPGGPVVQRAGRATCGPTTAPLVAAGGGRTRSRRRSTPEGGAPGSR